MDATTGGIVAGVLSGILAALVTGIGSFLLARQTFQIKIDEATRAERVDAYRDLWWLTGALPKVPRDTTVTYEQLNNLSNDFKNWYFGLDDGKRPSIDVHERAANKRVGGLYLSKPARDAYFDMQEILHDTYIKAKPPPAQQGQPSAPSGEMAEASPTPTESLRPSDYEAARERMHKLRNQLARDIGSRRAPGTARLFYRSRWD